ncbi:MAG: response regulator transcription factor [Chloroflexi bacterium]|nr:response regulator transcription factor [Chloroflexota bacterium]
MHQPTNASSTHSPMIRVLLADDHAVVRAGIRQFLERAGDIHVVAEAGDGEKARVMIAQFHPDVAVLDIRMPHASGIDVTRWIRTHYPEIGVLVLTAYDDDPYVLAVLEAGANGYVLKTASPAEIIQAVRDVYAGRSVLDPAITQTVLGRLSSPQRPTAEQPLTERELEVLELAAQGFTNKAIGVQLGISDRTVQGHLSKIYGKLDVSSRTEAVMHAVSQGWIQTNWGESRER